MNDFLEKMKTLADKGIEASKGMLDQAGETVKDLSDKGVTKVELLQLEKKTQKQFEKLGIRVYEILSSEDKKTVSLKDESVLFAVEEINKLKNEIKMREER